MKQGTEQLTNLLKYIKVNLHNKALGHYREMAWLPFQKVWFSNVGDHWKSEQNGGHLVFVPLEKRASKPSVL